MSSQRKKFVPLDCPVCGLLFRDLNDSLQYLEYFHLLWNQYLMSGNQFWALLLWLL